MGTSDISRYERAGGGNVPRDPTRTNDAAWLAARPKGIEIAVTNFDNTIQAFSRYIDRTMQKGLPPSSLLIDAYEIKLENRAAVLASHSHAGKKGENAKRRYKHLISLARQLT